MGAHSFKRALWGLSFLGAVVAVVVLGPRVTASPEDGDVAALEALCASSVGLNRKLVALDELVRTDTSASRAALERLTAVADERTAVIAIAAVGRSDHSGARTKLRAILESSSRSDLARSAALIAWCAAEQRDDASWEDVEEYLEERTEGNAALAAAASAARARVFERE